MNIFYTVAGVASVIVGVLLLLAGFFGKAGAKSVANGDIKPLDSAAFVGGGFLLYWR